ncbi:MAG TPA: hypothetical protein VM934_01890 [Pyrinomonadaceae bacterium]|nr:hypothetical protein [Pyrinomonadaceae bacterium]
MTKKFKAATICIVLAIGAGAVFSTVQQRSSAVHVGDDTKREGSLEWYADVAKSKGQTRINVPMLTFVDYVTNVKSLNSTLKYYRLVKAVPVEKISTIRNNETILTWYKFNILEDLSTKKHSACPDCSPPDFIPHELLPTNSDEIVLAERGGTVTYDGVELTQSPEYGFEISRPYLMFLEEDESGVFGRIMVGPAAVFTVNSDESLTAINDHPHSLKKIIKEQFKDSLKEIRAATKKQQ